MGITFAVRGDSLDARYSTAGKTGAACGTASNAPQIIADATAINGASVISFAENVAVGFRPLLYTGRGNTPSDKPRSILWRMKWDVFTNLFGLGFMGSSNKGWYNYLGLSLTSSKEFKWTAANEYSASDNGTSTAQTLSASTWYDVLLTWTGSNDANGVEIFLDGTSIFQDTCSRILPTYDANAQQVCSTIGVGEDDISGTGYSHGYLDELIVFDTIVDPSNVLLESGIGSLNGASRTSYVAVEAHSGLENFTEVGIKLDAIKANTDLIPAAL